LTVAAPDAAAPADLLDRLVDAVRTCFPDSDYVAPGGTLTVRAERAGVERIRIELPPGQFLHFQSLAVTATGIDDVAAIARLTASSWHGEYGSRFDLRRMLDFGHPDGTTVHTQADEPAWVELSFDRPLDLTELRLRNVAGATAPRACGLRITAAAAGEGGAVLYDAAARQAQAARLLTDTVLGAPGPLDEAALALAPIIAQALFGAYQPARTAFDALTVLSDDRRRYFRKLVSRTVLAGRQLEWTIHGPQRCFRFWSPEEKVRYLHDAVAIAEELKGLTPKVCFGFGAALAVVRDGDMIPHDDDLDIIVGFEEHEAANLPAAHRLIEGYLRPRGYTVGGNFTAHRHVSREGRKHLDVFVGLFEGDTISWYPGARGVLDRRTMYPTSEGTLLGVTVPLPRNPLVYLERVYGAGWRHPDPGFKHSWNRSEYLDLVRRPAST
jgi:hypothetical protein